MERLLKTTLKYLTYTVGGLLTLATVMLGGIFIYLEVAPPLSLDNQKAQTLLARAFPHYQVSAKQLQFHRSLTGWGIELNQLTITKHNNRLQFDRAIIYPSWRAILSGDFYQDIHTIALIDGQVELDSLSDLTGGLWGTGEQPSRQQPASEAKSSGTKPSDPATEPSAKTPAKQSPTGQPQSGQPPAGQPPAGQSAKELSPPKQLTQGGQPPAAQPPTQTPPQYPPPQSSPPQYSPQYSPKYLRLENVVAYHKRLRLKINQLELKDLTDGSGNFEILCPTSDAIQASLASDATELAVWLEPFRGECLPQLKLHWEEPLQLTLKLPRKNSPESTPQTSPNTTPNTSGGNTSGANLEVAGKGIEATPLGGSTYGLDMLEASVELQQGSLRLQRLEAMLGKLRLEGTGLIHPEQSQLEITLTNLDFGEMGQLWDERFASSARSWVTANIKTGNVSKAQVSLKFAGMDLAHLSGELEFEGLEASYLKPMALLKKARGRAVFDSDNFRIQLASGVIEEAITAKGEILLYDLTRSIPKAKVDVGLTGGLVKLFEVLESPPLNVGNYLTFSPKRGELAGELAMEFPLLNDLRLRNVAITSKGEISKAQIKLDSHLFEIPDASFTATAKSLTIAGTARHGKRSRFRFELQDNFTTTAVSVTGSLEPAILSQASDFISGGVVKAKLLKWQSENGVLQQAEWDVDLTATDFFVEQLNFTKPKGEAGTITGKLAPISAPPQPTSPQSPSPSASPHKVASSEGKNLRSLSFEFGDGTITATGNLALAASDPVAIEFKVKGDPHNEFTLTAYEQTNQPSPQAASQPNASGGNVWNAELTGSRWDASKIVAYAFAGSGDETPNAQINLLLNLTENLKLLENGSIGSTTARLTLLADGSLSGTLTAPAHKLELKLIEAEEQKRYQLSIGDLGGFLKKQQATEEITGGNLLFNGSRNNHASTGNASPRTASKGDAPDSDTRSPELAALEPIKGTLTVEEFRLGEIPFFVRLLNLVNISGLLRDDVNFKNLSALVEIQNGKLTLTDGIAKGDELTITFGGALDLPQDRISIKGTLVPSNTLNSILNDIPIIGDLLTGGQEGIIALNYSLGGKLSDPEISANPLSAITPGLLKRLLGGG